eukprot:Nk52_evm1s257 gene=Nk52_evmTU1s257
MKTKQLDENLKKLLPEGAQKSFVDELSESGINEGAFVKYSGYIEELINLRQNFLFEYRSEQLVMEAQTGQTNTRAIGYDNIFIATSAMNDESFVKLLGKYVDENFAGKYQEKTAVCSRHVEKGASRGIGESTPLPDGNCSHEESVVKKFESEEMDRETGVRDANDFRESRVTYITDQALEEIRKTGIDAGKDDDWLPGEPVTSSDDGSFPGKSHPFDNGGAQGANPAEVDDGGGDCGNYHSPSEGTAEEGAERGQGFIKSPMSSMETWADPAHGEG